MNSEEQISTKLLFQKIGTNDRQSFDTFFYLFYDRLFNFARLYVKNKEAAEEVVSDVFVNLWQHRVHLTVVREPEIYLFSTTKHMALNYLRKYSKSRVVYVDELQDTVIATAADPEKELEMKELLQQMEEAIESLPSQCKIIFRLVKEYQFKCREVAEIMQLSPRTIETQVFKAVKKLDELLAEHRPSGKKPARKLASGFPFLF